MKADRNDMTACIRVSSITIVIQISPWNKLASLEATLVRNYDLLTDSLTRVKCRATSVAKKIQVSKSSSS